MEKVRKVENRTARDRATEPREQNEPNSDGPSHGTTRTERNGTSFLPSFLARMLSLSLSLSFLRSLFLCFCLSFLLSFCLSFFRSLALSLSLSFFLSLAFSLFLTMPSLTHRRTIALAVEMIAESGWERSGFNMYIHCSNSEI